VSIIWKAIVFTFPLIQDSLMWKVGNGERVCIGVDPWVGSGEGYILLENLINILYENGIIFISNVSLSELTTIWHEEWKFIEMLDINVREGELWEVYITNLRSSHLRIKYYEDELVCSKNPSLGIYAPRVGYNTLCENEKQEKVPMSVEVDLGNYMSFDIINFHVASH